MVKPIAATRNSKRDRPGHEFDLLTEQIGTYSRTVRPNKFHRGNSLSRNDSQLMRFAPARRAA